jgi:hypothetical protein
MPESGTGQIAALHPGAIQVYNQNGSDISYYLNTGINIENSGVNWYDTNHAYWVYDEVLKKPVVQMIDRNGVWQAKYMGIGLNWTDMGLTAGDQYTISWLQWSSDGVKRAHAGLYWYDTTAGYSGFWDGLSDTGNTTPQTWTRVSQTFTLSSGRSLDQSLTWYMYGMYYSRATLRIADVQLEKKSHRTQFSFTNTRSATQGLLDLTGNSTIDLTNVSFDSNAQMTFDGSNDSLVVGNNSTLKNNNTSIEFIIKYLNTPNGDIIQFGVGSGTYAQYYYRAYSGNSYWNWYPAGVTGEGYITIPNSALPTNQYHHIVMTGDDQGYVQFYINGVAQSGATRAAVVQPANWTPADLTVGGFSWDGYSNSEIPYVKIYNRVLTASEIQQNFNAIKSRFNI